MIIICNIYRSHFIYDFSNVRRQKCDLLLTYQIYQKFDLVPLLRSRTTEESPFIIFIIIIINIRSQS